MLPLSVPSEDQPLLRKALEGSQRDLLLLIILLLVLLVNKARTGLSQIGMEDDQRPTAFTVFASPSPPNKVPGALKIASGPPGHLITAPLSDLLHQMDALEDLSASVPPGHIIAALSE